MSCMYVARDRPRVIRGRHLDECADAHSEDDHGCRGCQPCTEPHCCVCRLTHAAGTCAECMAETRETLHEIGRLCDALPEEVEHRGIQGEAMMLLGPAADPEARGHLEASILAGRVPADYLEVADGEQHPLFVLGTWDMLVRDALEHDEADERLTIAVAVDYLDRQLTYLGGYEHLPFEDMARDLRDCRAHIESVLHDGEQRDTGAPCMTCGRRLERTWSDDEAQDGWKCERCRTNSTKAQYAFAVRADYERRRDDNAFEWLPIIDCMALTNATRGSITGWASKSRVRKRRAFGRTEYHVGDIRDAQKSDAA